jgi:hypothetical protein
MKVVWNPNKKLFGNNKFNPFQTTSWTHFSGANLAVENLNSIFDLSATLSNQTISNSKPKKMNNNDEWFYENAKT